VPYLNRSLTNFRAAVNTKYPRRDKQSDGWIGDEAHQATDSDHNPDSDGSVDAWDMDVDLRSGDDPAAIESLKAVFQRHPASRYWIHNRWIAHRSTGWKRQPYRGSNPHDKHVHWNSDQANETNNSPWILGEHMAVTTTEMDGVADMVWYRDTDPDAEVNEPAWVALHNARVDSAAALAIVRGLEGRPVPGVITVDASAVATALAENVTFLAAVAKAVNDDTSRRLAA